MGTNKSFQKCIIMIVIVMVIITAAWNFSIQQTMQEMSDGYYNVIAVLLENVKSNIQILRKKRWIEILNKNELEKIDGHMLERYGIFPQDMPILSQGRYQKRNFYCK